MDWELEYDAIERGVRAVLDEQGRATLKNPQLFLGLFNDLEPEHKDEAEALQQFFDAGLGNSLYAVKGSTAEEQAQWLKAALQILTISGMAEKDARKLLAAIGKGAGLKPKTAPKTKPKQPKPPTGDQPVGDSKGTSGGAGVQSGGSSKGTPGGAGVQSGDSGSTQGGGSGGSQIDPGIFTNLFSGIFHGKSLTEILNRLLPPCAANIPVGIVQTTYAIGAFSQKEQKAMDKILKGFPSQNYGTILGYCGVLAGAFYGATLMMIFTDSGIFFPAMEKVGGWALDRTVKFHYQYVLYREIAAVWLCEEKKLQGVSIELHDQVVHKWILPSGIYVHRTNLCKLLLELCGSVGNTIQFKTGTVTT